jgi:DNA repair exonuclease SbcCD ATPase subunit
MEKLNPIHVKIENFQSIKDLDFEIRGLTVITGRSNLGKSSILRAISSALRNYPVVGMVRKGEKTSLVKIESDKFNLLWEKGEKTSGRYELNGQKFEKIGQNQLPEVSELGFKSVKIGSKENLPWYASQYEPLFLLNDSGASVTEFISEISRLDVLQNSISIILRRKKKITDKIRSRKDDIESLKKKFEKTKNFDILSQIEQDLKDQAESIRNYEDKIITGDKFFKILDKTAKKIVSFSESLKKEIPEDTISEDIKKYHIGHECHAYLQNTAKKAVFAKQALSVEIRDVPIEDLEKLEKLQKLQKLDELRQKLEKMNKASEIKLQPVSLNLEKIISANKLDFSLRNLNSRIIDLESRKLSLDKEEEQIKKEMGSIPICPTCSRPVNESHSKIHELVL